MAELSEAFAILIARRKPTVFGSMISPKIDIAGFLFDQQRRSRPVWNLGILRPQKIEQVAGGGSGGGADRRFYEMPGTGGLRKLRWGRAGMGKRGGVRVIYYYYNETAPLYLFMAYAKAAQENPSPAAMAILAKLVEAAKAGIKAKQKEKRQ